MESTSKHSTRIFWDLLSFRRLAQRWLGPIPHPCGRMQLSTKTVAVLTESITEETRHRQNKPGLEPFIAIWPPRAWSLAPWSVRDHATRAPPQACRSSATRWLSCGLRFPVCRRPRRYSCRYLLALTPWMSGVATPEANGTF